ncbi:hypothetical protein [Brevundimonas sp. Root1279]|uniref:hypothetical protein n=1 Tax=Brevundimonas sp. Root1279 TaxID=1736443 RepID=UPI0006F8F413|nr:hypothetical protein [Brevundimonas sp. Root1279]KQW79675.1 hypothetical protein ASC65_14070 [Brevundimonas sp. Root1279]
MTFILIAAVVFAIFWLMARSMTREKTRVKSAEAARQRLVAEHALDDAFVSEDDGSLIGLSTTRRILVLGDKDGDRVIPFEALRLVEGLRDDAVLVRAAREPLEAGPASEGDALPPPTTRTLSLRITADDPEPTARSVLFLDGGRHGLEPHNAHLRQQAALTEAWYRKVVEAMRG